MNVQYVNAILTGIKHVFSTMLNLPMAFENPITKQRRYPSFEISSMIGVNGLVKGCIILSMPQTVALNIATNMLEDIEIKSDENMIDAICEITNMVIGSADTAMELENVYYSLPTVSIEKQKLAYPENSFIFSMACILDSGKFDVDIALTNYGRKFL